MFHLRLSPGDERAGKNEMDVFLLHLVPRFPPFLSSSAESRCKTRKTTGGLGSFSGRSVGSWNCSHERTPSTPLPHYCTTAANVFRPKRGASPPKLLAHSLGVGAQKDASAVVGARNMEETGSAGRRRTKNTRAEPLVHSAP